jgi:hypothetical protein
VKWRRVTSKQNIMQTSRNTPACKLNQPFKILRRTKEKKTEGKIKIRENNNLSGLLHERTPLLIRNNVA